MPHHGVDDAARRARIRGAQQARAHLRLVAGGADGSPDDADTQPPNDGDDAPAGFTLLTW
ncbi:hypothetical protein [Mycolicibacterium brisbanense]|uniref:Zinc knuckle containing protein-like n=1 Tax=Mycolicibacterium brisbanense TaxID=146020 RepID=A0A100W482_9MYCO|nr:hypothetical protein [Mycolicibacterium brisbanense]MCV7157158.1 hypothetical protein [Mycolicibacterium brisbanense]GAS91281.1 zinc knuckle containing protein-like [Mycolicibacterium brisbanense]